jgi:hypothetical protein
MSAIRHFSAALALMLFAAAAAPGLPDEVLADTPAPIPTTLTIRDASQPPTPSTPATPFVSRPARRKAKRARTPRRQPAPPTAKAAEKAPTPMAQNPAAPKLEQRYQAPTESIFPLDPEPAPAKPAEPKAAPAAFPPEPAPAAK